MESKLTFPGYEELRFIQWELLELKPGREHLK